MAEDYFSFTGKLFDRKEIFQKPEALKGIRVLDLSHMIFGPTAARFLGQYGAEVIKVEVPYQGDYWRGGTYWGKYWKHSNPLWHFINHSKYFVAIDVKKPKGKELILKLAQTADVVIENFTSGTVEAWGIGYSQISKINPKVIYASLSTYGQSGPFRFFPGWDLLAQGASGVLSITGYPETEKYFKVPDFFGDFFPGYFAAMLMLIALNYREKTGEGQYLDICQAEILMRSLFHFTHLEATGEELGRTGNMDPTMAPSGIFKTKDGKFLSLAIATDKQFRSFSKAIERPDWAQDEKYAKAFSRLKPENARKLHDEVAEWINLKEVREVLALGRKYGFAVSEVMDDVQISEDEWRRERGSVVSFEDEMYKKLVMEGPIAMLSKTPGRIKWLTRPLGYHNRYALKKLLALSEAEIKELEKERVVGYWDYRVGQRPPVYYDIRKDPVFNYEGGDNH
ncbi:MAG: putative acyl-CoA transferase/carnitine dehydratase [Deltaproteobacteria bacterium]|nr:putative acyl-CoA transferase/carnitine dehydratase [Deltaproteobacteria bacterium]